MRPHHATTRALAALTLLALAAPTNIAIAATPASSNTIRITTASTSITDTHGHTWSPTNGFDTGDNSTSYWGNYDIAGTTEDELYRHEHVRMNSWTTPLPNGTYTITLKMREAWWDKPGQRVFSVTAEGTPALDNIDIIKAIGKNHAYDRTFNATITDGHLNLGFTATADSALISAIDITPTTPPNKPTPPPQPAPTTSATVLRMTTYTKPIKDAAGNTYIARRGFTGGDLVEPLPPTTDIKGTTSDTLYRPELIRWKHWSHPLPNGTYTITLHTREAFWNKPGQRIFDIKAEGTTKLTNIDIYKAAGKNTAHDLRLTTTVTDGRLDITPINKTNLALLSAITITRTDKKPTPPATTQRPSGMPFDSGLFPMHRADIATQFTQHRGRAADVITVFPSRENWAEMSNDWFMDNQRIPTRYTGTLDVGVPLWPDEGNLTTASTGGYNTQWENFGRMIAAKYPTAYIRLGWEMNLPGWKHAAYAHSATQWKQAYRHAVTALRKGGPRLRIAWVVNEGPGQTDTTDARTFYPGDNYVDYIGMDAYDWDPGYTNDTNIAHHRDAPYGWNFWLNFAKTHNKKFVLPEWGIAPANPNSGGDNPRYIAFVYDWLTRNARWIGYESYFHENAPYIRSNLFTDNPHATAEYLHRMKRP